MNYEDLLEKIRQELELISCYQIAPEDVVAICQNLGAEFPYERNQRHQRLKEIMEESRVASEGLREAISRLKVHTEGIKK